MNIGNIIFITVYIVLMVAVPVGVGIISCKPTMEYKYKTTHPQESVKLQIETNGVKIYKFIGSDGYDHYFSTGTNGEFLPSLIGIKSKHWDGAVSK